MFAFWIRRPVRPARPRYRPTLESMEERAQPSINIAFDFSRDLTGFFSNQSALQTLELAATTLSSRLNDTLAAITPNPTAGNTFTATFDDPATGNANFQVANLSVPANTLILYVGGRQLNSTEAGLGGPGGYSAGGSPDFLNTVAGRGKTGALGASISQTSYGPWGGSIAFDTSTNWYFDTTGTDPAGISANQTDFLTVAEHELCHVLGFGTAPSWENRVQGSVFTGPNAEKEFGAAVPIDNPADPGHWAQGTLDQGQRTTMEPDLVDGTTARLTQLDLAGLADLGWDVTNLGTAQNQPPIANNVELGDVAENAPAFTIPASTLLASDAAGPPSQSGLTITLTGVSNPIGGTISLVNGNAVFTPTANYVGPASFNYTIINNGRTNGKSDPKAATASASFNIDAPAPTVVNTVSIIPALTVPDRTSTSGAGSSASRDATSSVNVVLDDVAPHKVVVANSTPLSFTGKDRLSLSENGAGNGVLQVVLTASHGHLHLRSHRGVHVTGNNTAHLSVSGTMSALNHALASLQFLPAANFAGRAQVVMHSSDPGHGSSATSTIVVAVR
jgi:hypothetical protein